MQVCKLSGTGHEERVCDNDHAGRHHGVQVLGWHPDASQRLFHLCHAEGNESPEAVSCRHKECVPGGGSCLYRQGGIGIGDVPDAQRRGALHGEPGDCRGTDRPAVADEQVPVAPDQ